jgi:AbrB family looped-hinge helix DNA binding protein
MEHPILFAIIFVMAYYVFMTLYTDVVIGKSGRIVIPAPVREALALAEGTHLSLIVRDGVIELHDRRKQIDAILTKFRQRLPPDCESLTEALFEQRRAEAQREYEA